MGVFTVSFDRKFPPPTRAKKFGWFIQRNFNGARREVRLWWQRRTRGFDDKFAWNFDYAIASVIVPRLKHFRKSAVNVTPSSYLKGPNDDPDPGDVGHNQWLADIDRMIEAFEWVASDRMWDDDHPEQAKRAHEGIKLFAEHFFELWT